MIKRVIFRIVSLILFVLGLFLLNFDIMISGAFIGTNIRSLTPIFGSVLIIFSMIIFMVGESGLEKKIKLISNIDVDLGLVRYAEKATEDQKVQDEMNPLQLELMKGNLKAGGVGHVKGTNVFYLRGKKGARLFYRQIGLNYYEIVAKAIGTGKKDNEDAVIKKLRKIYGH